jgi:N-acetylglucosamine-6-phosphate deacetylase
MFDSQVEVSSHGRISQLGSPFLAGAALNLNECVARCVQLAAVPLGDALRLATANPGRILQRWRPGLGRLAIGAPADVITFDFDPGEDELRIREVVTSPKPGPDRTR